VYIDDEHESVNVNEYNVRVSILEQAHVHHSYVTDGMIFKLNYRLAHLGKLLLAPEVVVKTLPVGLLVEGLSAGSGCPPADPAVRHHVADEGLVDLRHLAGILVLHKSTKTNQH
jgi:hypothetical protein